MRPQIDETEPVGETSFQHSCGRLGDEHLSSLCKGANPSRSTRYRPADVARLLNLAGVQSHPEANPNVVRPWLGVHLADELRGCPRRSTSACEDRDRGVALAHRFDQAAAVCLDHLGHDGVVAYQDAAHLSRMPFPKIRGAFDVGHAQGDDAGGNIGFPPRTKSLDQLTG